MCLLVSQLQNCLYFDLPELISDLVTSLRLVALGFACLPDSSKISTATMTKEQHFFLRKSLKATFSLSKRHLRQLANSTSFVAN